MEIHANCIATAWNSEQPTRDAVYRLYDMVIKRLLYDCMDADTRIRRDARALATGNSEGFRTLCKAAGYKPEDIHARALNADNDPALNRKKYTKWE